MSIAVFHKANREEQVVKLNHNDKVTWVNIYDDRGTLIDQLISRRNFNGKVRR